ncbi:MAG: GNAT family N-acetyltransferase [Thermomicrobiales bacterium]
MTSFRVAKLERRHGMEAFDCGQEDLNRFLVRFALTNQLANASTTYLALADDEVVGFYTLVVGEIAYTDAPERLTRGIVRHSVPLMILARLAIDLRWQGRGIGKGLLKDAMLRTLQGADIAGIRALAVHAKDDAARAFYEHFGFQPSPTDPLHRYLLMKDLRRARDDGDR